jgi:hypothetical protein
MSENADTNPFSTAFEFQRTALRQSQEAVERAFDLQRDVNDAVLDSMTAGKSSRRESAELVRRSIVAYLDAVEATVPGSGAAVSELRRSVDETFDGLFESQEDAFDTAEEGVERSIESYDELSGEYVRTLEQQLDALLEAHETLEDDTVETFEEMQAQLEELHHAGTETEA